MLNELPRIEADAKTAALDVESAVKKAIAGVERWYSEHFHHAAITGTSPIPADQKSALVAHVTQSIRE